MDLKFYLALFLRRLPYFLLVVALCSALGLTLAAVLPPVYLAEARLLVESEQIPDSLAASTVRTEATEQLQIIQQRILTRDKLLEMANRLKIYAQPGFAPSRPMAADEIVDDLRKRIQIVTTGGGRTSGQAQATLVSISFKAPTAALSAVVTNEVVTAILAENVSLRTTVAGQTLDFFTQEVKRLDQELARQGAAILAFKETNKAALPDSLEFRRSQQAAAQERLVQMTRDESALKDRRTRLVQIYDQTGQVDAAPTATQTPEAKQLQDLRDQRSAALAVLSPENPRVKLLEAQIASLEKVVAGQVAATAPTGVSPTMTVYEMQLADIDGQLSFLADQKAQVTAEIEALRVSIDATPGNAIALDTLDRDYANTRTQYDQAVANKARAETGDTIEALSKGQRISIIEQAIAPEEPEKPNRTLIAAGGVGGGIALGLGLVVLMEMLNTAVRRPADLTAKLGITAFATLPHMRSRRQAQRRRAIIFFAFAVVLVAIPAGLWFVHYQVMPLDLLMDRILGKLGLAWVLPGTAAG